jgi:hypothetical protein
MKMGGTYASSAKTFLWVAPLMAVAVGVAIIIALASSILSTETRIALNAIEMMLLFPPIIGFIAIIGMFLVFALAQCFQAILTDVRRFNRRGLFGVLLALALTAGLAWYSTDYLTPSTDLNLGINTGPEWRPYRHGLTLQCYWQRWRSKRLLRYSTYGIAIQPSASGPRSLSLWRHCSLPPARRGSPVSLEVNARTLTALRSRLRLLGFGDRRCVARRILRKVRARRPARIGAPGAVP